MRTVSVLILAASLGVFLLWIGRIVPHLLPITPARGFTFQNTGSTPIYQGVEAAGRLRLPGERWHDAWVMPTSDPSQYHHYTRTVEAVDQRGLLTFCRDFTYAELEAANWTFEIVAGQITCRNPPVTPYNTPVLATRVQAIEYRNASATPIYLSSDPGGTVRRPGERWFLAQEIKAVDPNQYHRHVLRVEAVDERGQPVFCQDFSYAELAKANWTVELVAGPLLCREAVPSPDRR
jgi:hypothetical protein